MKLAALALPALLIAASAQASPRTESYRAVGTEPGWTLTIEGDPSMRVHFLTLASFTRNASIAEHAQAANIATGMQVLNAVPAVCEAPQGFATNATLPLIRSATGFAR